MLSCNLQRFKLGKLPANERRLWAPVAAPLKASLAQTRHSIQCLNQKQTGHTARVPEDQGVSAERQKSTAESLLQEATDAALQLQAPHFCAGSLVSSTVTVCCPPPEALLVSFPASEEQLHQLSTLCQEATFGRGGQDVLDPSYRKALALSNDKFFTNFDLGAQDVLTTIKSVMMPAAASIRAELYKLNVYRPGDFFKAHVDTPRGPGMFGSLVVCLPQQHTGGELLVRHKGEEQRFDFAAASSDKLQWAAFYSDCEHEILPVQSGHRITLTYNLYATASAKLDGPYLPGLDSSSLRLYSVLTRSLASLSSWWRVATWPYPASMCTRTPRRSC